jgi:hypothetical protein
MMDNDLVKTLFFAISVLITSCAPTVGQIESQIKKEIPIGSTKAQVVAYLDSHGYEHSANYKPELYYNKTKTINASVPKKSYGILTEGKIHLTLAFDNNDKLASYKVEEILTGL